MSLRRTTWAFILAVLFSIPAFWFFFDEPNPKVPLLWGFATGMFGSWLVLKIIDAARATRLWRARQGVRRPEDCSFEVPR